jgi:hypothetical protein
MRVLHVATLRYGSANLGVVQQMEWELLAARESDLPWDTELWCCDQLDSVEVGRKIPAYYFGFIGRRLHYYLRVRRALRDYDFVLVRFAPLSIFDIFLSEKECARIWWVFHVKTDDYFIGNHKILGYLFKFIESLVLLLSSKRKCGVIGVTSQIATSESRRIKNSPQRVLRYPNGIFQGRWPSIKDRRKKTETSILFVASRFYPWLGLERLLLSISTSDIVPDSRLYLIGKLTKSQTDMIENLQVSNTVIVCGTLSPSELDEALSKADLTLGAFDLHRIGLTSAATLKVRSSLGAGVPVYSGHSDEAFEQYFPYYIVGDPNWLKIVTVARERKELSRIDVAIRSRKNIDKIELLRNLFHDLHSAS